MVNAPPVAEAGPDRHVAIGEVISFDAGASHDPDGSLIAYAWDFGDGARGDGRLVQYAYHRSGVYRVGLTVRDNSATNTNTASDSLTVVVNEPPVAEAGPDQTVSSSEVHFDGTGSRDPDGTLAAYAWDFGDGGSGSGPTPGTCLQDPRQLPGAAHRDRQFRHAAEHGQRRAWRSWSTPRRSPMPGRTWSARRARS